MPLRPAISSDQTLRLYRGGIRVPDRVGRRRDVDLPVLNRVAVSRHSGSRSACALMFGFRRHAVRIRDYGTESSIGLGIGSACAVEPLLSVHGPVPFDQLEWRVGGLELGKGRVEFVAERRQKIVGVRVDRRFEGLHQTFEPRIDA